MTIKFDNEDYGSWLKYWLADNPIEDSFTLNYLHKCTTAEFYLTTEPHLLLSTTVNAFEVSEYPLGFDYTLAGDDLFDCGAYEYNLNLNLNFLRYDQAK